MQNTINLQRKNTNSLKQNNECVLFAGSIMNGLVEVLTFITFLSNITFPLLKRKKNLFKIVKN